MPTGTIKYLDRGGAWGFISRDDKQPKVFVHVRAAERAGFTELRRGQRWRFTLVGHFCLFRDDSNRRAPIASTPPKPTVANGFPEKPSG
ncbi:cold-shock protein [Sphingobium yanoikuyae]|nr:cold shock domain-containing protein [Sphingobium yanoikuyae]